MDPQIPALAGIGGITHIFTIQFFSLEISELLSNVALFDSREELIHLDVNNLPFHGFYKGAQAVRNHSVSSSARAGDKRSKTS